MVANILLPDTYPTPYPPPPDPRVGVKRSKFKIQNFQNMVMLHIKLKRIVNAATWWKIFFPQTPTPTLGMGSIGQISTFSEHSHVAYQI